MSMAFCEDEDDRLERQLRWAREDSANEAEPLRKAVRNWIQAEFDFRCGRRAYTAEAQARYIAAERKLRRALTGKGELGKSYGVLIGEKPKEAENDT